MREFWRNVCFVGRLFLDCLRRVFCVSLLLCESGCVNMYERAPWTNPEIQGVYQCSRAAAGMSIIIAFPQMMSDNPSSHGFMWENIFTIPLGCVCMLDAACEAVVDTVCFPFDYFISRHRAKKREERHDLGTAEHD